MTPRRRFPVRVLPAVAAALVAAGCSDDPSGPGVLELVVRGPVPLGAAVVQLAGAGVEGVEAGAPGWAELVALPNAGPTPVYRVVVVREQAGDLVVGIRVADVDAPFPTVSVIEASDQADALLATPNSVQATLRR